MKVLVAGGAGFIGSWLCEALLGKGFGVVCLDNISTGRADNVSHLKKNKSFRFIKGDVTKPLKINGGLGIIFHLASPASPPDYARLPLETALANTAGTKNLLELAKAKKASFVLASTSEVYGDPEEHPQREEYRGNVSTTGPRACYDESKRFAETLATVYAQKFGLRVKIARIFNTYGPRMRENDGRAVPNFIVQALRGEPVTVYGDGRQTRSFCYAKDLVEGLVKLALCDAETNGSLIFNLGNPDERRVEDVAKAIIKMTGSSSKVVHKELPRDDPQRRKPDISKARKILGWEPRVGFEEGLQATIKYFREKYAM